MKSENYEINVTPNLSQIDFSLYTEYISRQDLEVCHKYLRRMFTGIGRLVRCEDGQIVALVSPQQETLHLAKVGGVLLLNIIVSEKKRN